jgi:hypothetical protein
MLTTHTSGGENTAHLRPHAGAGLEARSKEESGKARRQAGTVTECIFKAVPKQLYQWDWIHQKTAFN